MVAVDESPYAERLIRRAWRMANSLQTDLIAVFVETKGWADATPERRRQLEENLRYAGDLGAEIYRLRGENVSKALIQAAHEKNAASIVVGKSNKGALSRLLGGSASDKLVRTSKDVDIYVVAGTEDGP